MVSALANPLWQRVKPCPISVARDAYRLSHRTRDRRSQTSGAAALPAWQCQPYLGAAAVARRNFQVGQSAHQVETHATAARACLGAQATPLSTTSIVRRPSVTRASTSIQPCESPGYACITAFEHASVKTSARSSANCCEQHPRHSLRTNRSIVVRSRPTSAGIARNRSYSVATIETPCAPARHRRNVSARTTPATRCICRVALPAPRRETDRWAHRR
jgi:hypothetical protein